MNVIGLTGLAGSGKSTVARHLVREHGYTRLSFSGPPKVMLRAIDPMLGVSLMYGTANPKPMRLSELLEMGEWKVNHGAFLGTPEDYVLGSQYGREYGQILRALIGAHRPEFWIDAALAQMAGSDGNYVFDDVSSQDQADVITGMDPWGLWNVVRPELGDAHLSARSLGEYQVVANISSLDFLQNEVDRVLSVYLNTAEPQAA